MRDSPYSKKRPSPHPHKVSTRSNKASPRTFQTALVHPIKDEKLNSLCFILSVLEYNS
jgi:hypothetical protein